MIGLKETPVSYRTYYKSFITANKERKDQIEERLKVIQEKSESLHTLIEEGFLKDKDLYKCDVTSYREFNERRHVDGTLLRVAKGIFANKENNYELVGASYDLFTLASLYKEEKDLNDELIKINRYLSIKLKDYNAILKAYYYKVHEKLLLDGCGYYVNDLGWFCINRCKGTNTENRLDYAATNANKAKLIAQGVKIMSKEEKQWCRDRGIEFEDIDYRVFTPVEAVYEFAAVTSGLPHLYHTHFTPTRFDTPALRKLKDEEIIEMCNGDEKKICQLDLGIKIKLRLLLQINKILYSKYIRNENQTSLRAAKVSRKNRQ